MHQPNQYTAVEPSADLLNGIAEVDGDSRR